MFCLIIIRMYDGVLLVINYYLMCGSKIDEELNNKRRNFNQHTAVQFYIQEQTINSDTRQIYSKQHSVTHKSMTIHIHTLSVEVNYLALMPH